MTDITGSRYSNLKLTSGEILAKDKVNSVRPRKQMTGRTQNHMDNGFSGRIWERGHIPR